MVVAGVIIVTTMTPEYDNKFVMNSCPSDPCRLSTFSHSSFSRLHIQEHPIDELNEEGAAFWGG